jgi:hypothetical protein
MPYTQHQIHRAGGRNRLHLSLSILAGTLLSAALSQSANAQVATNLIVSEQQYQDTGAVASLVAGTTILPNGTTAVSDGQYIGFVAGVATTNPWMNENPDASFGVTAPIFFDNTNPYTGSVSSSVNITSLAGGNLTNSFPSKSELSLNFTPNGQGLTFMGYVASVGTIDVSNGNTAQANDNTNPVASLGLTQRAIGQVSLVNGFVQSNASVTTTTVNAYSGNNGRAVILGSDGNYYMAGNAGNGGWTVDATTTSGSNQLTILNSTTTANNVAGASYSYQNKNPSTFGMVIGQQVTGTGIPNATLANLGTTAGSNQITVTSTSNLQVGMAVNGAYIPNGATVQSITNGTTFVLSTNATGTASGNAATANSVITGINADNIHFTINDNATATASSGENVKVVASGGMLSTLSADTGIQMIAQGSNGNTTVVGTEGGLPGSANGDNYGYNISQNGFTSPDKTGKDDNFRGLTLNPFNGLLYTTKGSGGNGINGIYQVGTAGSGLPGANASSTTISLINGFPANLATNGKNSANVQGTIYTPFGIWFAAANVMYVGDEGSGAALESASSAGLQKWVNSKADGTGTWSLAYVLQTGLNLGVAFAVPNDSHGNVYPTALDPANAGLRNITGIVNGDGTVTIWGVTSTSSSNTDQGADPNQLVSITDNLADTTASQASGESFNILETASYGEVLRGVAVVPEPSQWALMATGLLGTLGFYRRRK